MIKLLLIDEIHLLNDAKRGAVVESIVSRTKSFDNRVKAQTSSSSTDLCDPIIEFANRHIRFVVLSAGISNLDDVAEWIGAPVKLFK